MFHLVIWSLDKYIYLQNFENTQLFQPSWFGLWYINLCRLFKAKTSLYMYHIYIIWFGWFLYHIHIYQPLRSGRIWHKVNF